MLPQVNQNPALVQGYPKAVLTPNAMEFSRLVKAVLHREVAPSGNPDPSLVAEVAAKLGHVTILHKVSVVARNTFIMIVIQVIITIIIQVIIVILVIIITIMMTLVHKGLRDVISDGRDTVECGAAGSPRR